MTIILLFVTLCGENRKGFSDAECFNTTSISQFLFPDALSGRRWELALPAFLMKFMAAWMYNRYSLKFQRNRERKGNEGNPFPWTQPGVWFICCTMSCKMQYLRSAKFCRTSCYHTFFSFLSLLCRFYWVGWINSIHRWFTFVQTNVRKTSHEKKKTETGWIKRKLATSITHAKSVRGMSLFSVWLVSSIKRHVCSSKTDHHRRRDSS